MKLGKVKLSYARLLVILDSNGYDWLESLPNITALPAQ